MQEHLFKIDTAFKGFDPFFGSWFCHDGMNVLVDVGPAHTASNLIHSMRSFGLEKLDYIFLTHIHIDHSGALTDLLDFFPMARVVCHEKGIEHLVDPVRLWKGSLGVLGKMAELYGEPKPVPKERLIPHTNFHLEDLNILETPGHALHHLSYQYKGVLYAGEAAGNYFLLDGMEYIRPASPSRFFFHVFMDSVEKLLSLGNQPIRYAHFGGADDSQRLLEIFRDQLLRWRRIIEERIHQGLRGEPLFQECIHVLLREDPCLAAYKMMDAPTQEREQIFMRNSLNGFAEFLLRSEKS
jgi:glyoxylase-like metal-dependent hydrolase (beta-lactamase superfamily II)